MKKQISGNGVKVANLFAVVAKIEGKIWTSYSIDKMKSENLLMFWDYKTEGLTLPVAKEKLLATIVTRKKLHDAKIKVGKSPVFCAEKYLTLQTEKKKRIDSYMKMCTTLSHARNYSHYGYGNYKYSRRTFILPGTETPYPVTTTVDWSEDHDWNFYAKSYGRPKSTYAERAVVFQTVGKLGKVEDIFRFELTSFSGNFMEKAIAAFFKVGKVKCAKELKSVQLADYFYLNETHQINGYRLFERKIGKLVLDYAIFDTKTGNTFHSYNPETLISGLRAKIQAKLDVEYETITKHTGFGLGFCETGMKQFCEDNGVDFNGEYSRRDLRNIVLQKRELNCKKYRIELKQIGIILNCK